MYQHVVSTIGSCINIVTCKDFNKNSIKPGAAVASYVDGKCELECPATTFSYDVGANTGAGGYECT